MLGFHFEYYVLITMGIITIVHSKIYKGQFAVTEPVVYKDAHKTFHSSYLLKQITIPTEWQLSPIKYCNLECLMFHGLCKAFVYRSINNIPKCYVYKDPRICGESFAMQKPVIGAVHYDVQDGSEEDSSVSCYSKCIEKYANTNNPCQICGRHQNCVGYQCTDPCVPFCWMLKPLVTMDVVFAGLLSNGGRMQINCENAWQKIFHGPQNYPGLIYYSAFNGLATLLLKIRLRYLDGSQHESIFSGTSFSGSSLSVGNFVNGTAGNFWEAPFVGRAFFKPNNTDCYPFFYNNEVCDFQSNVTSKRYIWKLDEKDAGTVPITNIYMFVTEGLNT